MKELFQLFGAFFRIGMFLFGGGYSMLPLLEREIIDRRGWATQDEVLNYFAIGQCTPGVIAVNTATFVGQKRRGIPGAIFATLGIVCPSIIIITIIAALFEGFSHLEAVSHAFVGIRAAAGALIVVAVIRLARSNVRNAFQTLLCVASFVVVAVLDISPAVAIVAAALVGLFLAPRLSPSESADSVQSVGDGSVNGTGDGAEDSASNGAEDSMGSTSDGVDDSASASVNNSVDGPSIGEKPESAESENSSESVVEAADSSEETEGGQ